MAGYMAVRAGGATPPRPDRAREASSRRGVAAAAAAARPASPSAARRLLSNGGQVGSFVEGVLTGN